MEILEQEDPSLFQTMSPRYEDLRKRRSTAIGVATGSSIIGTALFVAWTGQQINNAGELGASPNLGTLIAGTVLMIGSVGLYRGIYNPGRGLLGFVNDFNRQTDGVKLRFTGGVGPVGSGWQGRIGMQIQF